jgi:group I intron endonuclease
MAKTGIYKITSPSGKIYIGQSVDIEKRWKKNYKTLKCKMQMKLYNSLKKYNPENHIFEIIEECLEGQLNEREIYWGTYYNVLDSNGLNLRLGNGIGSLSKETKHRISINNKGISRNKGVPKSKEHKDKMSKAVSNRIYTPERLEKMKKSMMGKNSKKIICITNNILFNSIREASISLNINERSISNNLLGYTTKTKNNLKFKYINI